MVIYRVNLIYIFLSDFRMSLSLCHHGTRWHSWLRHCATSRQVAGSTPDSVSRIFHWHNTSSCTMAEGSTQPLTEMSTSYISWLVCRADNLTTFMWRLWWNLGTSTSWNPQGLSRDCLTFFYCHCVPIRRSQSLHHPVYNLTAAVLRDTRRDTPSVLTDLILASCRHLRGTRLQKCTWKFCSLCSLCNTLEKLLNKYTLQVHLPAWLVSGVRHQAEWWLGKCILVQLLTSKTNELTHYNGLWSDSWVWPASTADLLVQSHKWNVMEWSGTFCSLSLVAALSQASSLCSLMFCAPLNSGFWR
jgi:hypothetical protein